jgi:hypothetical protein
VGFNTPPLGAVKLWQRLEFMVVNPTCTKNFLYKKNTPLLAAGIFYFFSSSYTRVKDKNIFHNTSPVKKRAPDGRRQWRFSSGVHYEKSDFPQGAIGAFFEL